jgi:hypothetical protein
MDSASLKLQRVNRASCTIWTGAFHALTGVTINCRSFGPWAAQPPDLINISRLPDRGCQRSKVLRGEFSLATRLPDCLMRWEHNTRRLEMWYYC